VDRTRATALSAAREVLISEGWDAVTQLRVAEVSGVGRATLYRHWPDRAQLLSDVLAAEELILHVEPSGDLRRDLRDHLRIYRDLLEDPAFGRVVTALVDRAEWEPAIRDVKARVAAQTLDYLRDLLEVGVRDGQLTKRVDAAEAAGQLLGPVTFRRLISTEPTPDGLIDRIVDDFLCLHGS